MAPRSVTADHPLGGSESWELRGGILNPPDLAGAEGTRLLRFAQKSSLTSVGFSLLDSSGHPTMGAPQPTYVTARMTHVFALASFDGHTRDGLTRGPRCCGAF